MPRQTIDFGIDLGTTNSAIAVMRGVEPLIIKNNRGHDITPSAVGFTKAGVLQLGDAAKRIQLGSPTDAYTEFKRRMGSDHIYGFTATGKRMKPECLSAEVLKGLKGDVEQASGESVAAAVITVPAAFELHQCDATSRAAELAGFSISPLVQEPVAAALAYGFQKDEEKAYWLVYDFGGGTFDAALIRAEEGIINVVAHAGDNFLGGSDIDWAILQDLLLPKLKDFNLPDFRVGNTRWEIAILRLKTAIERAKIEASRSARSPLIDCRFEDASGEEIDVEALGLELTQQDIARIAAPIISKSIALVKTVLASKNLSPGDLHKAILVGGPTQAPYFREQLRAELGAPVDFSVDPMTVVARGAAVFASTQKIGKKATAPVQAGEFNLDLKAKHTGIESDPLIGGRVLASSAESFAGHTIEFTNDNSGWNSGQAPVHDDGTFTVILSAERNVRNHYRIILRNRSGQGQKITPDSHHYTIGVVVEEQPIIHTIGIGTANNGVRRYFTKGDGLPQTKMGMFHTAVTVKPGQMDSLIRVPVVEGESEFSDRNRLIGFLDINGTEIRRELPEGQEIEVTLKIDASREITVEAFIPYLDAFFATKLKMGRQAAANNTASLRDRLTKEMARLMSLKKKADEAEDRVSSRALGSVSTEQGTLEKMIKDAEGDFVAGEQCDKALLDIACRLDEIEEQVKWPELVKEVRSSDKQLHELLLGSGTPQQKFRAEELHNQAEEHIASRSSERLKHVHEEMRKVFGEVLLEQPGFWTTFFHHLEQELPLIPDQERARRIVMHGRQCIQENNLAGLKNACIQLKEMLPLDVVAKAEQRGFGAGVI